MAKHNNISELLRQNNKPIITADDQGLITFVNQKFESTYLWSSAQLIEKLLITIIPSTLHDAHNMGFSRFLTTEKPTLMGKPLKLAIVKGDGSECIATHTIYGKKKEGRWVFLATIEPEMDK